MGWGPRGILRGTNKDVSVLVMGAGLAIDEARIDLKGKNIATPPMLDRHGGVSEPGIGIRQFVHERNVVIPR